MTQLLLQNLINILGACIAAVLVFFVQRQLRAIRGTTERTEKSLSGIDVLSTSSWRSSIEQQIVGLADQRSEQLAWQANLVRRVAALEQFARELDAFAHGATALPTYTEPVLTTTEGASDGD